MADGDFSLATLWVPVAPETSKVGPAMEDAGKEGKRRFGEGVKDLGHTITEDLEKAGSKVKDTFSGVGSSIKDIVSRAGKEGSDSLTASFSKAGEDAASSLTSKLSAQAGPLGGIADNLGKEFGGKLGGAIGDALKQIPGVDGVVDSFQQVSNKASEVETNIKGVTDTIGEFTKDAGGMAGKIGVLAAAFSELASVIGIGVAAGSELHKIINNILPGEYNREYDEHGVPRNSAERWLDRLPGIGPIVRGLTGDKLPQDAGPPTPSGDLLPPDMRLGDAASADAAPRQPHFGGVGGDTGFDNLFSGGSGIGGAGGTDWDAVHQHEAGSWDANTGNGYYGGLQFDQPTWNDFGGQDFAPRPDLATPDQQKAVANRVPPEQRAKRWPNTYKYGAGQGSAGSSAASLPDVRGAHPQLAYALGAAKGMFPDLTLMAGKDDHPMDQGWHPRGQAIDISGGTPEEQAQFSNWLLQFAPEIEELIHSGPGVTQNIKSGKIGPAIDMPGSVYNTGQAGYHGDHVHLAVTDQMASMFEAAISGRGASSGVDRGAVGGPTGAQHDPIYTAQADTGTGGTGGSSSTQDQAQQLGSGLVNGVLQEFGLDGSVFKSFGGSSNPLQFGITKLATGLINTFAGGAKGGDGASLGGLGGGGGSILPGLGGLIPHPAATSVPIGPSGSQSVSGGDTHIYHGPVNSGPQLNVTQNGVQSPTEDLQAFANGAATRVVAQGVTPQTGPPVP